MYRSSLLVLPLSLSARSTIVKVLKTAPFPSLPSFAPLTPPASLVGGAVRAPAMAEVEVIPMPVYTPSLVRDLSLL